MADYNTTRNATNSSYGRTFIIFSTLGFTGCLLNIFVCIIIRTRRALCQPFNHLILNLSVANFILSFSIILYGLSDYLAAILSLSNLSTTLAAVVCKLDMFCFISSLMATCLTLFIISIERYQAVTAIRIRKIALSTTRKVIVVIWVLSSMSAIIPTYFAEINLELSHRCHTSRIRSFFLVIVSVVLFSVTSIVPTILMLATYGLIIYKLYVNLQISPLALALSPAAYHRKVNLRRSIIVIIFISILSTGSCLPSLILNLILIVGHHYQENFKSIFVQRNTLLWYIFNILFLLTPTINPFLYNLASGQFRNTLHQIFRHRCHCLLNEPSIVASEPMKRMETLKTYSSKTSQHLPIID